MPATKRLDREDIATFLKLLPATYDGRVLQHAIEAGHESFADPTVVALLRQAKTEVTQVGLDAPDHPTIADASVGFVYLRLQRSDVENATRHAETDFAARAKRWKTYGAGSVPGDLPTLGPKAGEGGTGCPRVLHRGREGAQLGGHGDD